MTTAKVVNDPYVEFLHLVLDEYVSGHLVVGLLLKTKRSWP
jgi:hypothetical protein